MDDGKYFSRSWALLTRDKGWIKPLLVMAAASLVPVAGALGNRGYALEWARLSAWGADAAPKQKNVNVTKCIASGFRGFLVLLGWGLIFGVVTGIVEGLFSVFPGVVGDLLASLVSLAVAAVSVFWGVVVMVAQVRAAIYESAAAGYQPKSVVEMIRRDSNGFVKVCLVNLACTFVIGVVAAMFTVVLVILFVPTLAAIVNDHANYRIFEALAGSIVWIALVCAIFGYLLGFVGNAVQMLVMNAVGLWMRQFDVPNWGRSEDPLPTGPARPQLPPATWQPPVQQEVQQAQARPQDPTPAPDEDKGVVEAIPLVRVERKPQADDPVLEDVPQEDEDTSDLEAIPVPELKDEEDEPSPTPDDLYDDLYKAIRENDRVPGDDEEDL